MILIIKFWYLISFVTTGKNCSRGCFKLYELYKTWLKCLLLILGLLDFIRRLLLKDFPHQLCCLLWLFLRKRGSWLIIMPFFKLKLEGLNFSIFHVWSVMSKSCLCFFCSVYMSWIKIDTELYRWSAIWNFVPRNIEGCHNIDKWLQKRLYENTGFCVERFLHLEFIVKCFEW